ncbi:hypothetical protein [Ruminococcus sp. Marseille-P6503]|uniref:hypothetical protein n=1 Tax=Ruminococcus sp. Marseille-P6503 TaxID=2364796 RepID=UPI000F531120|nr:hypothetical protein [Ruminococcus sp. Marseille-P6503]
MKKYKILSFIVILAVSAALFALPVYADEEKDGDTAVTDNMTTDSSAPTLAFDSDDWSSYIGVVDDTESGAYSIKKESDVVYQGAAVSLSANLTEFPDYATDSETTMGILFEAEKFGLENFDGCTLNFYARFNINIENLLFENSVYAFGENADGEMTSNAIKTIKFNMSSNVNGYEKQFVTVPSDTDTTRIILKVPVSAAYEGDVLYLDNVTLLTPFKDDQDNTYQIKTLDTYNSNAKVTNTGDVIKQAAKGNTLSEAPDSVNEEDGGFNPLIIVAAALVAALAAIVIVIIIRHKNKFY